MTAYFPHRKMWFAPSIAPGDYGSPQVGEWADMRCFGITSSACFKVKVTGLEGAVNFSFETADADASDQPDMATVRQMGNCDICDESASFADGILTVDPAEDPYASDGFQICTICVCCPGRFVRAVSDNGGAYDVEVIGLARNLARA